MASWIDQQIEGFGALRGRHVLSWAGEEMAVHDRGPFGLPQFRDPAFPCLQVCPLTLELDGGHAVDLWTYQNDDEWALMIQPARVLRRDLWGQYRWSRFPELPTGFVAAVEIRLSDAGDPGEVLITVGGRQVLLVAAEIDETHQGTRFARAADESILVFAEPAAADGLLWSGARATRVAPS